MAGIGGEQAHRAHFLRVFCVAARGKSAIWTKQIHQSRVLGSILLNRGLIEGTFTGSFPNHSSMDCRFFRYT